MKVYVINLDTQYYDESTFKENKLLIMMYMASASLLMPNRPYSYALRKISEENDNESYYRSNDILRIRKDPLLKLWKLDCYSNDSKSKNQIYLNLNNSIQIEMINPHSTLLIREKEVPISISSDDKNFLRYNISLRRRRLVVRGGDLHII